MKSNVPTNKLFTVKRCYMEMGEALEATTVIVGNVGNPGGDHKICRTRTCVQSTYDPTVGSRPWFTPLFPLTLSASVKRTGTLAMVELVNS